MIIVILKDVVTRRISGVYVMFWSCPGDTVVFSSENSPDYTCMICTPFCMYIILLQNAYNNYNCRNWKSTIFDHRSR